MSILSVDDVAAGFAGSPGPIRFRKIGTTMEGAGIMHSLWYEAGVPGAGAAPSGGINGQQQVATVTGQVPFVNAATGKNKHLGLIRGRATQPGSLFLMDRIWANSSISITTTTSQTIAPGAMPSRDVDGAALGNGWLAALEVSTATGNVGAITNTTLTYTNEAGTASRTGTITSFPASAEVGTFVEFNLQAGDKGVRTVQGLTLGTSYVSGTVHVVLYRPLAVLHFDAAHAKDSQSWDQLGLPRLFDGTVPFFTWVADATTAVDVQGVLAYAEK